MAASYVVGLEAVSMRDIARVGGKNASLGELLQQLTRAGVHAVGGEQRSGHAAHSRVKANAAAAEQKH